MKKKSIIAGYKNNQALEYILRQNPLFMKTLQLLKETGLEDGWISGGLIRNTVWNYLHGYELNKNLSDIDIVYYHNTIEDIIDDTELDGYKVEFRNQAFMYKWYEQNYGIKIPKFKSVEESFPLWSDTCNSIIVRFDENDSFEIKTANGLIDLLSGIIRPKIDRTTLCGLPKSDYYKRLQKWDIFNQYPNICVKNHNNQIIHSITNEI